MNAQDQLVYHSAIESVSLNRQFFIWNILKQVYGNKVNRKRGKQVVADYQRNLNILCRGTYQKRSKQKCVSCPNNVNGSYTALVTGDAGDATESDIELTLINPILNTEFAHLMTNNQFTAYSQKALLSFRLDSFVEGQMNNMFLEYKKLGYFRTGGTSLKTTTEIASYSLNSNPLMSKNNVDCYVGGLAKQIMSYLELSQSHTSKAGLGVATCGSNWAFGVSSLDTLTEEDKLKISRKLGITFTVSDVDSGFYSFSNIPFGVFSMHNPLASDYIELMCRFIESYLLEDADWFVFKKLWHDEYMSRI